MIFGSFHTGQSLAKSQQDKFYTLKNVDAFTNLGNAQCQNALTSDSTTPISVPIGSWKFGYEVNAYVNNDTATDTNNMSTSLSTANNSHSDVTMSQGESGFNAGTDDVTSASLFGCAWTVDAEL